MSVDSLYAAFTEAVTQETINATILPLMGKLVSVLGVDQLSLDAGVSERLPTSARLTGNTEWVDGSRWTLIMIGRVDDSGRDVLSLELRAQSQRGFVALGTLVSTLPVSRVPSPDIGGTLMLGPSVLTELGPEQATVSAQAVDDPELDAPAPTLDGWLMLTQPPLDDYAALLGGRKLALSGQFDPRENAPIQSKINLVALAPSASTAWQKMDVEAVSLGLTTNHVDAYSLEQPPALSSAVLLTLTLSVDTGSTHDVTVTVPLLLNEQVWDIDGLITPPLTLSDGIAGLLKVFPGTTPSTFSLPPGVAALDAFGLSQLRFGVKTSGGTQPVPSGIAYTGATIVSTTPWDVPIPFIRIEQVGASWLVNWRSPKYLWGGSLFGTMRFGSKTGDGNVPPGQQITDASGDPVFLDVSITLPDLTVQASTRGAIAIDMSDAMSVFFPGTQPSINAQLVVDRITMGASLPAKTYGATLTAHGDWEIPVGDVTFTLDNVTFEVNVSPAQIWGGLAGMVGVYVGGQQKTILSAGAYYPGDGSWLFQGGLATGTLDLTEFVFAFFGQPAPSWLPELELTRLWASYSTGEGNPYSVSAAVAVSWDPEILGLKLLLTAEADIKRRPQVTGDSLQAARDVLNLKSLALQRPRLHQIVTTQVTDDTAPAMIYEGAVKGSFELNNLIVTAGLSFISQEKTWLFRLQLDRFALEARTAWTGTGNKRHQVLTVEMKRATLGAMVESFTALANPNLNYRLEAPWTFLDSINLGSFTLVIDPTEQSVTLDYALDLTLGFITIKTVGIRYDRKTGEPQVNIEITGNFLGKDYGREPGMTPLAWDALNDSPPAVPGNGNSLIDLRYLGFGQHVSLDGLTRPDSLSAVITLMREQLQQVGDPLRNPLDQPSGSQLHFDENSQWLIGLDMTVMGTATVKLVMHDPDLYGVLIALAGPEAGSLAGFSFELLYKKVTDDIGVFHARLQVPDMFRQLDFGAVAITLGIITVDVFTNGNFKVDLGFPHSRNFSVSFGLQYGPFMGKGGIYFGLLNGATSTRVPAITNGTFSPVLELGLGLAVGVGREFNKGPLKAGLYVQLEVIFEGVLAWFHPDDMAASTAMYYWANGTAALVGKVYGKVDFKVIAIDVSFEAYAAASLTLAAYRPTLIEMSVGVRVHASIKVLFVRISFSFSTSLDVSFTVGSASTPPWVLAADQSGRQPAGLTSGSAAALGYRSRTGQLPLAHASRHAEGMRRRRGADLVRLTRQLTRARLGSLHRHGLHHALSAQLAALSDDDFSALTADPCSTDVYQLDFSPDAKVYANGAIQPLDVRVLPSLTVANMPVQWPAEGASATADGAPAYRTVIMLSIDGPAPQQAARLDDARLAPFTPTARAATQSETPFAVLSEGMFRWAVSAIGLDPINATLTAGDLAELAAQMECPQTFAQGFSFENLCGFLAGNLQFRLSAPPEGGTADTLTGVSFPMPPTLGWSSADLPPPENSRDFSRWQPVDNTYAARIAEYFARLSPQSFDGNHGDNGGIAPDESLASVVLREYLLMITQSMVQAAQDLFVRFPTTLDETSQLSAIAASFPTIEVRYVVHLGDTVEQVAATYGYSATELLALNPDLAEQLRHAKPGSLLTVTLGATPESIAGANPEQLLQAGKSLFAAALETQILADETPEQLCTRLGTHADQWLQTPDALDVPSITLGGAPLAPMQGVYANPGDLSVMQVAALFYVRSNAGTAVMAAVPHTEWYAQAITELTGNSIGADGQLPAVVQLPSAYDTLGEPVSWTRLVGDTLPLLAAATALWQNPEADVSFSAWLSQVQALNPEHESGPVTVPAHDSAVLPDETLRALASRLLLVSDATATTGTPTEGFRQLVAETPLLAPLASVVVSQCTLPITSRQSLRDFAAHYDLSIETLGRLGADVPGLIVPDAIQPLIVPTLPAITLDSLMPKLTADAPIRDVAGQVSRFMLHGLRLPSPNESPTSDVTPLAGMYDLIGQQVTGPAPDDSLPPDTARLTLTMGITVPQPWLAFVNTQVVPPTDSALQMTVTPAELAARNPAAAGARLRPGMVVETDDTDTLSVVVTEQMLAAYPATTLVPALSQLPQALPLWEEVPVRHGLAHMVQWQASRRPALPAWGDTAGTPANGMPSFWPFNSSIAGLAASTDALPWQLYRADPQLGPDAPAQPVDHFVWATLVDIRIQRVPGRPHTADLIGADTVGRQVLLELWKYLRDNDDDAELFFGFQLSPAAGLSAGLVSVPLNRNATYLVRTNLSTETRSGNATKQRNATMAEETPPPSGPYFAPMSDARGFLTLAWEASVIGGGGYWLELSDMDGNGYSEEIWASDGMATVTLIAVLNSQSKKNPDRQLHGFNTAALVGDPVDTASCALFVAAPDDRDQTRRATVAPGNVGFAFTMTSASASESTTGDTPAMTARQLYSLAGYKLTDTPRFASSNEGRPASARIDPQGTAVDARRMSPRMSTTDSDDQQHISRIIPVHRYAKSASVPQVPGLPSPMADPYAGISSEDATAPPVATVRLAFHDIFGNSTASSANTRETAP